MLDERVHAVAILSLLHAQRQDPADPVGSWVHRRVERAELIDENLVRNRWSIEFQLPPKIAGIDTAGLSFVPLTWLPRDSRLRQLELADEEGRPVPLASEQASATLAVTAMETYGRFLVRAQAERVGRALAARLHDKVHADLSSVASDRDSRTSAIDRLKAAKHGRLDRHVAEDDFQRATLMSFRDDAGREANLAKFLEALEESYVLLAIVPGRTAQVRRTLTMSWCEHAEPLQPLHVWLRWRMSWAPVTLSTKPRNADMARAYELELARPSDELEVVRGALAVYRVENDGSRVHLVRGDDRVERGPALLRFTMNRLRAVEGDCRIEARAAFQLRARPSGLPLLALLACLLSSALLVVGSWNLEALEQQVEGAETLLLVIPGLLGLYIGRPGEHALATDVLSGIRCMAVTSAFCVLVASLLLVLEVDPGWLELWWTSLLTISLAATAAVAASNVLLRLSATQPLPVEPKAAAPAKRPGLQAGVLFAASCAACVAVALLLVGGSRDLGIERRFKSALEHAAGDGREARVGLWSFAREPWTRMHVFGPSTTRPAIVRYIGTPVPGDSPLSDRVAPDELLLVLLNGSRVVATIELPTALAERAGIASAHGCTLHPTDQLLVNALAAHRRGHRCGGV